MTEQIDVLHVITDADRRGAQIFAVELAGALAARGCNVRTVALGPASRSVNLPVPVLGPRRLALSTLRALRKEVTRRQVVVGFGSSTLPALALTTLGARVPFIYLSISQIEYWANTALKRARVRRFLERAEMVVCLWPGAGQRLETVFGVSGDRIRTIPSGVSTARFDGDATARTAQLAGELGLHPGKPVVVYVGALAAEKQVSRAVDAVAMLPGAQLLLVGDGPERAMLEQQARTTQCPIIFTGVRDDLPDVLQVVDVILLPSKSEGLPGVLIEAGLAGVPAVATAVGGVADIVRDGVTGALVAPDAAPEHVARALEQVLSRRTEMGTAARAHCLERFAIEGVAERWERLLREVAGHR